MSGEDDVHRPPMPHEGWQEGEVPVYGPCRNGCGQKVRIDRLDLMREHAAVCAHRTNGAEP